MGHDVPASRGTLPYSHGRSSWRGGWDLCWGVYATSWSWSRGRCEVGDDSPAITEETAIHRRATPKATNDSRSYYCADSAWHSNLAVLS